MYMSRFERQLTVVHCREWVRGFAENGGGLPGAEQEPQAADDDLLDTVMLRLRLADGLDLAAVAGQHGGVAASRIRRALEPHMARGLVASAGKGQQSAQAGSKFRLTDPAGFLVSNDVISDVFAALRPDDA